MRCYEWFKRFKEGRISVSDDPRPGRFSTSTNEDHVDRFRAVIRGNRRLTVREFSDEVGISIGSCHKTFTEKLQIRRVSAKFVLRLLTDNQKENRYLAKHHISVVPHSPYSPDVAPGDPFPFPKLKTNLKGRRFQIKEKIN
jgi:hypothetical protein